LNDACKDHGSKVLYVLSNVVKIQGKGKSTATGILTIIKYLIPDMCYNYDFYYFRPFFQMS